MQADAVENTDIVIVLAMPEEFPATSVMRADCAFAVRVQFPDGSAGEIVLRRART